ncbi:MAG: DUF4912 domain-containing protein [Clostridia bacterium]|nr:DUF4912 domain-containing protein [Clostridia bacterium]
MHLLKSEYYDLPIKYDQTLIRLLVQSPTRMYAYWEVSDDTMKYFSNNFHNYSDCTPTLKITNITKNYSYLIPIDPFANNYYIDVEDTGCDYKIELGRTKNNEFLNIYTSNNVTMPVFSRIDENDFIDSDEVLFGNYLCIADKKKIKVYTNKESRKYFQNQTHTEFENITSSDIPKPIGG